jgi:hypothetical protein
LENQTDQGLVIAYVFHYVFGHTPMVGLWYSY